APSPAPAPGPGGAPPPPRGGGAGLPARPAPCVLPGPFVNATALACFISARLAQGRQAVTVLACGERWLTPAEGEELRFAVEDWLAAGAILSHLALDKSPEAQACEAAFRAVHDRLEDMLLNCGSGIELCDKGYRSDVLHAARMDLYSAVPLLAEGRFVNAVGPSSQ